VSRRSVQGAVGTGGAHAGRGPGADGGWNDPARPTPASATSATPNDAPEESVWDEPSRRVPQIALRGVNKIYPGHPPLHVLKDINVTIGRGEFVAILGPSGSGKTTMLSIMGTLDQPTTGQVWIDGVDAAEISEVERASLRSDVIGFVFQQFFLLPSLSAVDNVAEGMLYQRLPRSERRRRALEALDMVGLAARASHRPGELSGGEQQRVAIARAIAGEPHVLFADEPTGALDQHTGHMIVDYLREIAHGGTTVVVITHDAALAEGFDRKISVLDGQIVGDLRKRRRNRPAHPDAGARDTRSAGPGLVDSHADPSGAAPQRSGRRRPAGRASAVSPADFVGFESPASGGSPSPRASRSARVLEEVGV